MYLFLFLCYNICASEKDYHIAFSLVSASSLLLNMQVYYEDVKISKHAQKRAKERMGLSKKAIRRDAKRAYKHGLAPHCFKGSFRWYLDRKANQNKYEGVIIKVYGKFIYYFSNGTLITVIPIPKDFKNGYKKYEIKNE